MAGGENTRFRRNSLDGARKGIIFAAHTKEKTMNIEYLYIEHFRGIQRFEIQGLGRLAVVAGINGAGKTSLLVAVKILLSWFIARVRNAKGRGLAIDERDITHGEDYCLLKIRLSNGAEWQLYRQRPGCRTAPVAKTDLTGMMTLANEVAEQVYRAPQTTDLPLIDAYGVNRVVSETPMRVRKSHKLQPLDAWTVDMSNSVNFHDFFVWFREMEDIENESLRDTGHLALNRQLQAVRGAIARWADGYSDFKVQRNPKAFIIKKQGVRFDFNQLSDGEKSYIALVLDIARKMAMTHPSLEHPLEGDGIVLIDEIDLHLHPAWQREVVGKLQAVFPRCQFVITTHSPQVVSCVNFHEGDRLIGIYDGTLREETENPYGQESDMILAEAFRMKSLRNPEVEARIATLWQLIEEGKAESKAYREGYQWLAENVSPDDAIFRQLRMQEMLSSKMKKG
jgi:predicted ATP-binding protein involved in virulence